MRIHTTHEAVEPIANILYEAGANGLVIEDSNDLIKEREQKYGEIYELNPEDFPEEGVILKAYFPINSFLGETVEEIKNAINNLLLYEIDLGPNEVTISEINEEEWATAWKKYYHPVKISEKFTIVPTWEEYEPAADDRFVIELDPGMAFGTGTHPTTILSIQALERLVKPGDIVYDVGTGSGILSIASVLLGAKKVHAVDLDEVALKSARLNIKLNKVQDRVYLKQNNLLDGYEEKADVIVANLLAEIIVRLAADAFRLLKPGGYLIASGIINQKRKEVENVLKSTGFSIFETVFMEDWITIITQKTE
ncbi:MAG: 50S ribosomal protein L11 methyltransferase [Caldibacillus sp.]